MYRGEFRDGNVNGDGTLLCKSGLLVRGTWALGRLSGKDCNVLKPTKWSGLVTYESGNPIGTAHILATSGDLRSVTFDGGLIVSSTRVQDDAKVAQIKSAEQELGSIYEELQKLLSPRKHTDVQLSVAPEEGLVVSVNPVDNQRVYYVRFTGPDKEAQTTRFSSAAVTVPDLDPTTEYNVAVGFVRHKTLVPVRTFSNVCVKLYTKASQLFKLPSADVDQIKETVPGAAGVTLYTLDDYPGFVSRALTVAGRVGYHEKSSTFIHEEC